VRRHRVNVDAASAAVEIEILGQFRVTVDGTAVPASAWSRRTAAALVKVLALAPGHRLHRERVMDLLWPDEPIDRAAPRLHKAAHFARRATGRHDAVVLVDDVVQLFPGATVRVDALRFERLARTAIEERDAGAAREAIECYGGELLPDDRYEEWAADRRELLHLRRVEVLRIAGAWRDLAEIEPTDDEAQTTLIREHLATGDVAAALERFEVFERFVERELGIVGGSTRLRAHNRPPAHVDPSARAGALVAELGDLMARGSVLLAELATVGSVISGPLQAAG
jgi:DNA-binding SARP family transcriptional activator